MLRNIVVVVAILRTSLLFRLEHSNIGALYQKVVVVHATGPLMC